MTMTDPEMVGVPPTPTLAAPIKAVPTPSNPQQASSVVVALSPTLTAPTNTTPTSSSVPNAPSSKPYLHLSPSQLSSLHLSIHRHTPAAPISSSTLTTFMQLVNDSFSGPYKERNFGGKPRYTSPQELLNDLSHGEEGGWVFILSTPEGQAVAGAKVTRSGEGMDGGQGVHDLLNPDFVATGNVREYYLGALGSISPGAGGILIKHIKEFLEEECKGEGWKLKAYTVAEWGPHSPPYDPPKESKLLGWFVGQGFVVEKYSWKPKGTWGSFYGGILVSVEYVHLPGP